MEAKNTDSIKSIYISPLPLSLFLSPLSLFFFFFLSRKASIFRIEHAFPRFDYIFTDTETEVSLFKCMTVLVTIETKRYERDGVSAKCFFFFFFLPSPAPATPRPLFFNERIDSP